MRFAMAFPVGVVCLILAAGTVGLVDAATGVDVQGYAMAVDGDYAIVGAQWHDAYQGAAYVFKRTGDGWSEPQKLSPPDLGRFDHFGGSVSISGDYAVVGATWQNLFAGAVYVFKRDGNEWVQQEKLTAGDARPDMQFGYNVGIDGSEITVGAGSMDLAYRFQRSGDAWVEEQKMALSALERSGGQFGRDLIESEIGNDLLVLAETLSRDTETPPLLAPTSTEHYFIRGDVFADGIVDEGDQGILSGILEGVPASCEDAADVNDDGMINEDDWDYLAAWLYLEGPAPPSPFPLCGPDTSEDGLGCAEYTGPCFIVTATDGAFEDRVEIMWSGVDLDAIIYRIERNGTLISVASSEDSLYADYTANRGVTYEYCVIVTDMVGGEPTPACDSGHTIVFAPADFSASDWDYDQFIRLTWTDMSSVEAGYLIKRDDILIGTAPADASDYNDSTAITSDTHLYQVMAFDADSIQSTSVEDIGTRAPILPPLDVSASDGTFPDFVELTWTDQAADELSYVIHRDGSPIAAVGPFPGTDTVVYHDYAATFGYLHEYCVFAQDSSFEFNWAERCDSGGIGILPAPQGVLATDSTYDDRVEISWTDVSDSEEGFEIRRDAIAIDTVAANTTLYRDTTATPGTVHEYCVVAINDVDSRSAEVCDNGLQVIVVRPSEVQATDGEREDRVDITWNSTATKAVLFNIYRGGDFIKSVGVMTRFYSDYGGTAGQEYEYTVLAVTALLDEAPSVPDTGSRVLDAPAQVTASDDEYEEKIVVTWADNSRLEHGYLLTREHTVTTVVDSIWLTANRTSYTDWAAVPGVIYDYSVAGFDSLGEAVGFSEAAADRGRRILSPPSNIRAGDGEFEKRVEITWVDNSKAEDGYYIYRDSVLIDSTDDNFTSYVDTLPVSAQTSEYSVTAFDSYGESEAVSDSGSTIILPPGSFNASDVYEDRVELNWVDLSEIEEIYIITRNGVTLDTVGADITSFTDATAASDVTYQYCVRSDCFGQSSVEACDNGRRFSPTTLITEMDLRLLASDGESYDDFGRSVAISGDVAIIGAYGDDADKGSAYIFERAADGTWSQAQKLLASDGVADDWFGAFVAISGDVAIVGAYHDDDERGSAYIFERGVGGTWPSTETAKLVASDGAINDRFGISVAISGDVAIVGAYHDDDERGSAYIFERGVGGTWPSTETAKLVASDGVTGDEFGVAVAISDGVALVGARRDDSFRGSVYIFERGGGGNWTQTQKLLASDGAANDFFGNFVAISGGVAIVGARGDDSFRGSAYIFERGGGGTWTQTQKLLASDGAANNHFGLSVAISAGVALVGAEGNDAWTGSAYIFERAGGGSWPSTETAKLLASDGVADDMFGGSVGISGGMALVGANAKDDFLGAAYVWPRGTVVASDGSLNSRVRVEWRHHSSSEDGFHVYRDDELIATLAPDVAKYEDFEAQPGRTYEYGVAGFTQTTGDGQPFSDFGWRPPDGNITGAISTPTGTGVDGISVGLDPQPIRSLLLDGTGGHVSIPDRDRTFDFTADSSYTIEAWIRYSGAGSPIPESKVIIAKAISSSFPFLLSTQSPIVGQPGRLQFEVCDRVDCLVVCSSRSDLNDDTWHHVACVHDAAQDQLRMYVDGTLDGDTTYAALGDIRNTDDLTLGVGRAFIEGGWFGGQIDEVRIWSLARDSSDIQATMNLQLEGDEDGLLGYWPLDEGESPVITDLTVGANYGFIQQGAYWADNAAPIDISVKTDLEGNYSLDKIRYGQETTFEVQPYEGDRQFSPAFKAITLSTEHPVENQVNFIETSSFTVSGVVDFPGTDCGAPDVQIHVDGVMKALTDKNGKFAVAVSYGDHWIKPFLEGRTFDPDSVLLSVEGDLHGVSFSDTTIRTLSGLVGGGCGNNIGEVTIQVRSENDCLDSSYTWTEYDQYEISLPPQKYLVSVSNVVSIPQELDPGDVLKFFDNLGDRVVDLTNADSTLDFIYRAPLEVTIEGLDEYITCGTLTFQGRNLPDSLPVIPQGTHLSLTINVNENYGPGKVCPLDSGTVIIIDEIFDMQDSPIELTVKDGVANYNSFASTPSLIAGRVDPAGNDRSFQKALTAMVTVEGRTSETATEWALVTGHVAGEGSDFVTATMGELPMYILRDPPGDQSYAFIEEGEAIRTSYTFVDFTSQTQVGVGFEAKYGLTVQTWVGVGGGSETTTESKSGFAFEFLGGVIIQGKLGTDVVVTTTEEFSTSANEALVGQGGDVYVGTGFNFIFAEVGVVEVEGCEVVRSTSIGFEADSTSTIFAYTHQYIHDVLIPVLESQVTYYDDLGHPDSAAWSRAKAQNWIDMLAYNDSLKQQAVVKANRSFSAGADFAYSHETETTKFYSWRAGVVFDFSADIGQIHFETPVWDFRVSALIRSHTEVVTGGDYDITKSMTVGYVLSDDDIGDHYTVDIKEDPVYPTPVFEVLAGASSCPYEPWPDENGDARMIARDKPVLLVNPNRHDNIAPDEPAVFTLTLSNQSPTHEEREYILRELTTSNPGGAIISANGAPISQGVSYLINGDPNNNSNEVTLTVERGPTRYSYPDLTLMLYPPCDPNICDMALLTANFDAPCSDITLLRPEPGWTFNKADEDTGASVLLILTDYELAISETDSVESVWGQYRRLGTGLEGPEVWENIAADTLDFPSTMIEWLPPGSLDDGVYELRAYTKCANGRGYSNTSVGTIDRNAPQVLGAPEPADEELSFGEKISITFNEQIDCGSINSEGLLTLLDGPTAGDTVDIDLVCDGINIVITPAASVDPADLEGRLLQAHVADVLDLVGNPIASPPTWTFTVNQSVFTWNNTNIAPEVAFRAPGSITAELVNGSDSVANFTIPALPSWITEASPNSGSVAPGGTQNISFTIQEDIALGSYDSVVVAESDRGNATLEIYLTVSCYEPVWELDPGRYEHTMTIIAKVKIEGGISGDPDDRVAAFVGNQLRGVANVDSATPIVFLTVGSNRTWGETMRFEVWDESSCMLYNSTLERFAFVSNGRIGSPDNPELLTATDVLADNVQAIPLIEGWNWFSTYVRTVDMSPNGVLSDLTPAVGDIIKSDGDFATFDPAMGWVGGLLFLDNVSSYMISLSEEGTILQEGSFADPDSTPVPVGDGWNWIGYLRDEPLLLETAIEDLSKVFSDGDVLKSQTAFAQFYKDVWYGDLDSMDAGMGYKLYLASVPASHTFNYPSLPGGPMPAPAGIPGQLTSRQVETEEALPGWSVNRRAYQYNMTVIATLNIEGDQRRNENDMIGAFVDGECRGVARPIYLSAIDRYVAFLMIHSNSVDGERVAFQAFVPEARAVYDVAEAISYEADAAVGTVREPLALVTKGIAFEVIESVPTTYSLSQNYPNPFNAGTVIFYSLGAEGQVSLEVFDVLGRKVAVLVDKRQPAGHHQVAWNGRNASGKAVASGIYFYRLTAGDVVGTRKMVLLK